MKVSKTIGGYQVEVEADKIEDVVKAFSDVAEVLDASQQCQACKGKHVRFQFRHNAGFDFYEVVCGSCRARLSLGQFKGGGLFPSRKHKDGSLKENFGWEVYRGEEDSGDSSATGPANGSADPNWRNYKVPLGGNQGIPLGDLSVEVIRGYVEHYDTHPPSSIEAKTLHIMCRNACKELLSPVTAASVPDDDIPF